MAISYKPKTIIALLVAAVIIPFFSYFFFKQVEYIIHHDLYSYGLVFSNSWADLYSLYSSLYVFSSLAIWFFLCVSIICFLVYDITKKNGLRFACVSFLVFGIVLNFFNIYVLYRVDSLVNSDLYSSGLRFSVDWYSNYWSLSIWMWFLVGLEIFLTLAPAILINVSSVKKRRVPARLFDSILIAMGTVILSLSIIYSSSILALIGLGLLFWGVTFTYVSTEEYIKKVLLQTSASAQLTRLNQVIEELEFMGNPMYLPPQYFKKRDTYKAYIPKDRLALIPTPEQMCNQEPTFFIDFIDTPPAVLMTPPGAELVQLFETMLKKNFSEVDLVYIQQHLPKLLIEDLEIVHYFDIAIENETVRIKIEDSVYNVSKTEPEHTDIYSSFGSPLSSALACILAKVANSPVVTAPQNGTENRSETIEYRILRLEGETGK